MRVFLSAGEASGDAYAAALVRELLERVSPISPEELARRVRASHYYAPPGSAFVSANWDSRDALGLAEILSYDLGDALQDSRADELLGLPWSEIPNRVFDLLTPEERRGMMVRFQGVGGKQLGAAIGNLVADSSVWGAVSITQSLKVGPKVAMGYERAKRALKHGDPGLFIPIDFGFFNIRLCKVAKRRGWKVMYFVPPGSWRRDKQGRDLPTLADAVVTPFPWSADILRSMGANVHFFGHPIKQLIRESANPASMSLDHKKSIAILAGSRTHEVERNLPMIADAVRPEWPLEFAVAPNLDRNVFKSEWERHAPKRRDTFTQGDVYGVLGRAKAAIVCSGTATLEAALMGCPHVVVYRITKTMAREAKLIRFKLPKFISLPNIVLDRTVVPELVGLEVSPEAIRTVLEPLIELTPQRTAQLEAFHEIEAVLGPNDAISKASDLAMNLLQTG